MSNHIISRALPIGLLTLAAAAASAAPKPGPTTPAKVAKPEITPEADRLLKQMTAYLAGLPSFKVDAFTVDEVVTKAGQKIQVISESQVAVERPNKLRSEQVGSPARLSFWYDGKNMSLYCKSDNTYGTVVAPPTIDATIDTIRKQYKLDAPGADLIYSTPYDVLTEQVKSGQVIGQESIGGVTVNHLAFVGDEVDWQVWITASLEPFPLRYVITTKTMKEQPQFTLQLTHWEPRAKVGDMTFKPPPGATQKPSLPTQCGATP
jgi:hypothetical protein